jgi:hypothetical protein
MHSAENTGDVRCLTDAPLPFFVLAGLIERMLEEYCRQYGRSSAAAFSAAAFSSGSIRILNCVLFRCERANKGLAAPRLSRTTLFHRRLHFSFAYAKHAFSYFAQDRA